VGTSKDRPATEEHSKDESRTEGRDQTKGNVCLFYRTKLRKGALKRIHPGVRKKKGKLSGELQESPFLPSEEKERPTENLTGKHAWGKKRKGAEETVVFYI